MCTLTRQPRPEASAGRGHSILRGSFRSRVFVNNRDVALGMDFVMIIMKQHASVVWHTGLNTLVGILNVSY